MRGVKPSQCPTKQSKARQGSHCYRRQPPERTLDFLGIRKERARAQAKHPAKRPVSSFCIASDFVRFSRICHFTLVADAWGVGVGQRESYKFLIVAASTKQHEICSHRETFNALGFGARFSPVHENGRNPGVADVSKKISTAFSLLKPTQCARSNPHPSFLTLSGHPTADGHPFSKPDSVGIGFLLWSTACSLRIATSSSMQHRPQGNR